MGRSGKKKVAPEIHHAEASIHDRYGAMGATAGFDDEPFEPDAPVVEPASSSDAPSSPGAAPDAPSTACSCGTCASRSDSPRSRKPFAANPLRESSSNALEEGLFDEGALGDSSATTGSFARFQCLYESRDGKMAVFEDEHGHIVAVNTQRLA